MDQFDFSAPIRATILFDDSDDETFEKKPSIQNFQTEKEESSSNSLKVEQVQDETKKPPENSILLPTISTSKTKTCVLTKDNMESNIEFELIQSVNCNKQKKQALKPKPLDMPLLEENNNVNNDNPFIGNFNKIEEIDKKNRIRNTHVSEIQKQRETPIDTIKVCKRKLTEEPSISDKTKTARKISVPSRISCPSDINLTDGNNIEKTLKDSNELNPTHDNYEIQKEDSSEVAMFSKYFVSCNQTLPNNKISQIESPKKNIETDKTPLINIEINPTTQTIDQAQSNGDKSSQSLNEQKAADNYIKNLLNTVSQHMLYIFDSYQSYVNLLKSGASPILIENAKNNYFCSRGRFFDLSYSTVINIIIPKNNEPSFVMNFLIDTMQMGHSMSYNCLYEQIEAMYSDMINWVQKRQTQIQNMNRIKKSNPMLARELQKPCSVQMFTHQNDQVKKRSPSKKSTQSRLPHKSTNQSSNLPKPNLQVQHLHNVQQLQNSTPQNKPSPSPSNQNQLNVEHLLNECFQSHRFAQHNYIGSTYQNAYKHYYENRMPKTHPNQNPWQQIKQNQRKHMTTSDTLQSMQNQITNIEPCANYNRQVQGSTLQQDRSPNAIKPPGQEQLPYIWKRSILPSYPQNDQQQFQETVSSQNNHHWSLVMSPEMTTQVEASRSSISRDSGFMSPLNFNTSNDLSSQDEQRPQWSTTPLITHVTSLNPTVSLIKDGNCAVCGKVTKQKCLGCFNCYYCSHGCQFQDWQFHQLVCK